MLNKNRKKAAAIAIACVALLGSAGKMADASFVDDWATQVTSTSSGYHQGSGRGYLTGGSFSARWPMGTDNLMTISRPNIKAGCGGIDMFLGGFSFLDVDKLVEKLQRILSAAPAAAFDIALKTLAPQVSDTIKSLEALVEKLNNLQLDDCKAAKALVSVPIDAAKGFGIDSAQDAAKEAMTDFMVSSGLDQDWKSNINQLQADIKDMFTTNKLKSTKVKEQTDAAVAGCPETLKNVIAAPSLMSYLGSRRGIPAEYIDIMKAYIGDVVITQATGKYDMHYHAPCEKVTFDSLLKGPSIAMEGNTIATKAEDYCKEKSPEGMQQKVTQAVIASASDMRNKSATLTPEQSALLDSIPMSIKPSLAIGIMAGIDGIVVDKLTNVAATSLVYSFVSDLIAIGYQLDYEYQIVTKNTDGTDMNNCKPELFQAELGKKIKKFTDNLPKKQEEARAEFAKRSQEGIAVDSLMAELTKFRTQVRREVSRIFTASVATRMGY